MKGFAKLLKNVDEIKNKNNASDEEISDLLARISIFYRNKNETNERNKLLAEAKDQVDSLCRGLRENDLEKAIRHLKKVDEYLDEIEKYN